MVLSDVGQQRAKQMSRRPRWRVGVLVADLLAAAVVVVLLAAVWTSSFGTTALELVVLLVIASWPLVALLARGHGHPNLGITTADLRRIAITGSALIAVVSTGFVLVDPAAPAKPPVAGLVLLVAASLSTRAMIQRRHRTRRMRGRGMRRVVVVGHGDAAEALVSEFRRTTAHGFAVAGVCTPQGVMPAGLDRAGLSVGDFASITETVLDSRAHAVTVLSCPELDRGDLRRLAWDLEKHDVDLLIAPGLIEVATPRLAVRPVAGLPLLHLGAPEFRGSRRTMKAACDRLAAAMALVVLAIPLAIIALLIVLTSEGPVLFRQQRVGRDGRTFSMLKFRSMVSDAEDRRGDVLHLDVHNDGYLFKIHDDPRVTRVGRWLRRYSVDETPQLINVVAGHMSLVGPRPALPDEVSRYADDTMRRLRVKPGITGLWQVSGRSDLTAQESIRLDLWYVDNWSLALDLLIVSKTLGAVVGRRGAY